MRLRLILTIYITVLVAILIIFSSIQKDKRRFEVLFTYDVDFAFYEMAKTLYAAKNELYDYNNTLEILYHDKKKIFSKPIMAYQDQFPKIKENIDYLEKLLNKKVFTDGFRKKLTENHQTLQKVTRVSQLTHTILTFWTLGIAKIWGI